MSTPYAPTTERMSKGTQIAAEAIGMSEVVIAEDAEATEEVTTTAEATKEDTAIVEETKEVTTTAGAIKVDTASKEIEATTEVDTRAGGKETAIGMTKTKGSRPTSARISTTSKRRRTINASHRRKRSK